MATRDGRIPPGSRRAPRQPRWRLVAMLAPLLLLSLGALALLSYRTASEIVRQQALQQLRTFRLGAARGIEDHFSRVEGHVTSLARDPSTLLALRQLSEATTQLDIDPLTEPAKMRPQMERLKRFLEDYYRQELIDKKVDLRHLLLSERSAVWLQATYVASPADPSAVASQSVPTDAPRYDRLHAAWHPYFQGMLERFAFDGIYVIDAASGRVVYSTNKLPDFQTSLRDGPYAASTLGALFRDLQSAPDDGRYRIVDFAPYPPAHGTPAAFAGAPILDRGRVAGALVAQLPSTPLTQILSGKGQWTETGLGETGEAYLVGRGDPNPLMRSEPRFGPLVGGPTAVLRQPVTSRATSPSDRAEEIEAEYVNYRGTPVLGSAGRLNHLNGLDWNLVTEMTSAEASRPLAALRGHIVWVTGLLFVGALLLVIGLTAVVATPPAAATAAATDTEVNDYRRRLEADLRPVLTAVVAASEGDLSQRIVLDGNTLGRLPQALNRMWRGAGALVRHVHDTTTIAIESAQQIQTAVGQLSQDALQHTTALATTGTLLRETQSRFDALVAEATMARHAGQLTDSAARQGAEAVGRIVDGTEAVQKHARTLTMRLKRLGERSMEISTVTATIQEITAQANMLALNATIEASRAGEHGLGFKAVANDVRKLAARTEAAAKDMADLATALHSEAADAVDCVDTQGEEIERQVLLLADAAQALGRCRDLVAQNGRHLATSPTANGEPTHATSALNDAVQRVAEFVRRTHVLSEHAVHSSAALLKILSELNTWAQTFRVRGGSDAVAQPAAEDEVIELEPREAVGNGRGVRA